MTFKHILIGGAALGLFMAAWVGSWPRLPAKMAAVTRSETSGDQMILEYRVNQPFTLEIEQSIREIWVPPDKPGIHVGRVQTSRNEQGASVASRLDWTRGEHYVLLTFTRGRDITIQANGQTATVRSRLAKDAAKARWDPPGNVALGNGVGKSVVNVAQSADEEELVTLAARWP